MSSFNSIIYIYMYVCVYYNYILYRVVLEFKVATLYLQAVQIGQEYDQLQWFQSCYVMFKALQLREYARKKMH